MKLKIRMKPVQPLQGIAMTIQTLICLEEIVQHKTVPLLTPQCRLQEKSNKSAGTLSTMFLFLLFFVAIGQSFAQTTVTIPVETKDNALVFQTDKDNRLGIIYFGKKLLN